MIRERFTLRAVVGLVLFLSGCAMFSEYGKLEKSARENYIQKEYDTAMSQVTRSLRIKPDYAESQQLIKEVFPKALNMHLENIKDGGAKFKWDDVVTEYKILIHLNDEVKSLPILIDKETEQEIRFDIQNYSTELGEAKNNAAETHYQEGHRLFGKKGIQNRDHAAGEFKIANKYIPGYKDASTLAAEGYYQEGLLLSKQEGVDIQKQAAKAFTAAQVWIPGYKDSPALYAIARKAGIKRLAMFPFEDKSGKGGKYGAVGESILDGIVSNIMNDFQAIEFLEIVSRDNLDKVVAEQKLGTSGVIDISTATQVGGILGVHEILTGQITKISVTPEQTTSKSIQQKTKVCDRTKKVVKDGKERTECIMDTVVAKITIYNRKAGATISGSYKVIDVKSAKLKETQHLNGSYHFESAWATFSGDKRALKGEPKRLTNQNEEKAPVADELVNMAEKDLIGKLSGTLKQYAR